MSAPIVLQWSGGKDSALALHALAQRDGCEVVGLLATFTERYNRVTMHGVRRALVEAQVEALGQTLIPMYVPSKPANEVYNARLRSTLTSLKKQGIETIATGDVFLDDVRQYREAQLQKVGMTLVTPIWGRDPRALVRDLVSQGFRAMIVCVSAERLDKRFLGRTLDEQLLEHLPDGVDPGGEYGEYHTFVYEAPLFQAPIGVGLGETVSRNGHHYQELVPGARQR